MAKRLTWLSEERRIFGGVASRKRGPHFVVVVINAGPYIQTDSIIEKNNAYIQCGRLITAFAPHTIDFYSSYLLKAQ